MAEDEQGVELEKPMEISVRVEDENDNAPLCDEAVFEVQENEPSGKNPHRSSTHKHSIKVHVRGQISIRSIMQRKTVALLIINNDKIFRMIHVFWSLFRQRGWFSACF